MKISERFIEHNKTSPVVSSSWLDKNKRSPSGSPDTWMFSRKTLEDGTVYTIPAAEVEEMNKAGISPRWKTKP